MFSQDQAVKKVMNEMIVNSLHTDGQHRNKEFQRLQQEMGQSSTQPQYLVVDPYSYRVLAKFDYNEAIADDFGQRLEKAKRRFLRIKSRQASVDPGSK